MPKRRLGLEADFFFEAGPYTNNELKVVRFEGSEALSEPFHFQLGLAMEGDEPDFEAILGKAAMLTVEGCEGTRYVCGIVSKFEQSGEPTRLTQYKAELVPKIWLLGLTHKSRIFQEMSVPNIIKKVLTDAGIPASDFQLQTKATYPDREYCVQYRESDLAFISRLMEEEGIYYWFEHSKNKHVLIMGDASSAHTPIDGDPKLYYQTATGQEPDIEHIYKFRYAQAVRPGEVVLRDFDFKKPKLDLTTKKAADRDTDLEIYDYPGEYTQPSVGTTLSEIRLQELQTSRRVGDGMSNCRRLLPGFKFKMSEHPRTSLNQEYLLTAVHHSGEQIQVLKEAAGTTVANEYKAELACIPSKIQFRPARVTPRPLVPGSQTAIVTGPKGEEIYPDEHGRVKVQFHWDREGKRDEKSSCWIRVSQTWAGPTWGAIIIPRIGQEVIVQFLEGDPDRPIITGTVYNGDNRPPFALPGGKTQAGFKSNSTLGGGGYNEFVFDDTKGKELIRVHGQYDKQTKIEHDERITIGNNRTKSVGVDESTTIGKNRTEKVGADEKITIGANRTESVTANEDIKIGANRTESVVANETISIGGNRSETVTGNETITVAITRTRNVGVNEMINIGGAQEVSIGGFQALTVGGARAKTVGGSETVNIGADESANIGGSQTVGIGSDLSEDVGKNHSEKVGKNLTIDAGDEILLKTGKASITLKKDGTITIEGKDITVEGSGEINEKASKNIVLKGQKILQN
jgi:type VI secretion system secreted protein VgrG